MGTTKTLKKFRHLVTNTTIPKQFTDMIREETSLFWSKPLGSSLDFHRAFHSEKTHKAIRYVMALTGLTGDENALTKSLSGLKSSLHFKIEPQYKTAKGRLRLSHFEVKGYASNGYGEILKVNTVAKKMMMGTPADPVRTKFAVSSLASDRRLTAQYSRMVERWHNKILIRKQREQLSRSKSAKRSQTLLQKEIAKQLLNEPVLSETPPIKYQQILDALDKEEKELDLKPKGKKKKSDKKNGIRSQRRKKPTRKLTQAEKKRILRFFIEFSKHLQGIMWVFHYTIKLNDKRRKFMYQDKNFTWIPDNSYHPVLDLYGFPDHMQHYLSERVGFLPWKLFITWNEAMEEAFDKSWYSMKAAHDYGRRIEGEKYADEEEMQDALDVLLDLCSEGLRDAANLYDKVASCDWIFQMRIVKREFKVPTYVQKHKRHTQKNRAFKPEKERAAVEMKINYYRMLHGRYWENLNN